MFVRWNFTVWGDPELLGDLVVREAAGERAEDRQLPLGEAERLRARLLALPRRRPSMDVPLECLAERGREVVGFTVLTM